MLGFRIDPAEKLKAALKEIQTLHKVIYLKREYVHEDNVNLGVQCVSHIWRRSRARRGSKSIVSSCLRCSKTFM